MNVASRLAAVRTSLNAAARACGRDPADIGLVAVSKTHPVERVEEAMAAGQVDFGESYAQELAEKAARLSGPDPARAVDAAPRWHFIGRIQRNKVKWIAPLAWRVHGVTHVEQAEALAARAPGPLSVLLNVNVGREATKDGIPPEQALQVAERVHRVPGITLVGLMCLPPLTDDPEEAGPYFAELAALAEQGRARDLPLRELSMGMSHDAPVAVRNGATWVRVGTAIFGVRT